MAARTMRPTLHRPLCCPQQGLLLLAVAALLVAAARAVPLPRALHLEGGGEPAEPLSFMHNMGGASAAKPRTGDIPYIRCQVCELLATQAWKQGKQLLKQGTPDNPVHEDRMIELVEQLTSADRPEGKWLCQLELVPQGERLAVQEKEQAGACGVECKTVERAAEQIMGEHDTDVAEALFVGKKSRAQLSNWLCYELSGACKHKPPPLPKERQAAQGAAGKQAAAAADEL